MSRANLVRPDDDPRIETALQLASRLMALLKSGRAYAVGHIALNQQFENYLLLLEPMFAARDTLRLEARDGDICLDGERLPYRAHMERSLEQLAQEFGARHILGVEFSRGLTLGEFATFMGYFLPGERWKGAELISACADARLTRVRALAQHDRARARTDDAARLELPAALGSSRDAWGALLAGSQALLAGDALDQGVELRHLERLLHPLIDAVLAGERVTVALARITPGEPAWAHAAHTTLTSLCLGARLGLARADLAVTGVSALLHDAGHDWTDAGSQAAAVVHTHEGLRRLAWATTFNRTSLAILRTAFEHHGEPLAARPAGATTLASQVVAMSDAYTTLLARDGDPAQWLSPSGALARVLGPLRPLWHPALATALVRALGLYPPGQWVELDDGSLARALAADPGAPERSWVEFVSDARRAPLPAGGGEWVALPSARRVVRALPRGDWPEANGRAAA